MMKRQTRREFLASATASCAAAAWASSLQPATWAKASKQAVGIQLYMVKDVLDKDPAGTLRKLASFGYEEVETFSFANRSAADFCQIITDAGLRCPSAHLYFGMVETAKLLDDAKALGVQYVVSSVLLADPPPINGSDFSSFLKAISGLGLDDFKKIAALANHIGEQAKKAGLQYAYHNHNFEFRDYGGKTGYSILLEETNPEFVTFEADCGWMTAAGVDPVEYFHRFPGRFRMVHIKDFLKGAAPTTTLADPNGPRSAELGRGSINYKPILAAAKHAGIKHYFVEQEPPFTETPPLDAAKIDCDYIRPLLG